MLLSKLDNRQFLFGFLGLAIIVRLCLMPFFAHVDLFSEYRRVMFAIENGHLLDNSHRVLIYYIEIVSAWFGTWFIPVDYTLFHLTDPSQSTSSISDYRYFLNDPYVYRYLFFFKLPYLIFDVATAVVIWRFIDNPALKRIALLLWLFNPLTLFATYIFGRFEVISLFFLCVTAYQLKQHRLLLASVLFGLSLWCREINLLFLPVFLIALIDAKDAWFRNAIVVALGAAIVLVIMMLPDALLSAVGGNLELFLDPNTARSTETLNKLLQLGYYWFYPVVIGLFGVLIYTWECLQQEQAERFVIGSALLLAVYFAFNVHSIHYTAWLMIFPILAINYNAKMVTPMIALWGAWLVLWLLKTDAGVFTLFLEAPLNQDFMHMGHFPSYFNAHIATNELSLYQTIQIFRSIFAATLGFMAYRLITRHRQN